MQRGALVIYDPTNFDRRIIEPGHSDSDVLDATDFEPEHDDFEDFSLAALAASPGGHRLLGVDLLIPDY